jgi:hypothetical protein
MVHRSRRNSHEAGVWLRKNPMDLGACVCEERGHGEVGLHILLVGRARCVCPAAQLGRLTDTIVDDTAQLRFESRQAS